MLETFSADAFISQKKGQFDSAFGMLIDGYDISIIPPKHALSVLHLMYQKYLEEAVVWYSHADDVAGPALREAYVSPSCSQDVFDFLICGSLLSFAKHGIDLINNKSILYEPSDKYARLVAIESSFKVLKTKIDQGDLDTPWLLDCCDLFGKDDVAFWLDIQIGGIKDKIALIPETARKDGVLPFKNEEKKSGPTANPKQNVSQQSAGAVFEMLDYSDLTEREAKEMAEDAVAELNSLVGHEEVKDEMLTMTSLMSFDRAREIACGTKKIKKFRNMIFCGSPGVGKTTVARLVGQILAANGTLPEKKIVFCNANELIGKWVGWSGDHVDNLFDQGSGGIIIIDEAGSLAPLKRTAFHEEALNAINARLGYEKDNQTGTLVIFTCYPQERAALLEMNPGLNRRFPTTMYFPDCSDKNLEEIFKSVVEQRGYTLLPGVTELAMTQILEAKTVLGPQFGNASAVETFVDLMESARSRTIDPAAIARVLSGKSPSPELKQQMSQFVEADVAVFDPGTYSFRSALHSQVAIRSNPPAKVDAHLFGYH